MYKDILLCVSEEQGRENLITVAAEFAKQHGSRLTGMFKSLHEESTLPVFGLVAVEQTLHAAEHARELYADTREQFKTITQQKGVDAQWLDIDQVASPLEAARYTDLIMASQVQKEPNTGENSISLINSLLLESAHPIVLLPTDWEKGVQAKRFILGWNESREAMRAVQDAMSLLQAAEKVYVLTIVAEAEKQVGGSPLTDYLRARDVNCEFHSFIKDYDHSRSAEMLLESGDAYNADLYVLGGYGHSRLREVVLGGVTRHMIQHSNAPVLFSH
ncbi:MAG: universal stress protein [Arenicella sp.]|nr:universal stress protein [Arenicella sp.]